MYGKEKSSKTGKMASECNPMSIKEVNKGLASSPDTVNPFSIRKSGKSLAK